jgi:hypothetical protein
MKQPHKAACRLNQRQAAFWVLVAKDSYSGPGRDDDSFESKHCWEARLKTMPGKFGVQLHAHGPNRVSPGMVGHPKQGGASHPAPHPQAQEFASSNSSCHAICIASSRPSLDFAGSSAKPGSSVT